jgi:hypothetical protein
MVRAVGAGPDRHQAKEGARAAEGNKAAVLRFYEEVINGTDLDAIDELLTPDGVDHTFGSQSAEEAKQFFGMLYQPSPTCSSRSTM